MKLATCLPLAFLLFLCSCASSSVDEQYVADGLPIQYLEIVTPDVDATCAALESIHGVSFSEPQPHLANSRTAPLESGARIGVRAPMRGTEVPVVRIYARVTDIHAATEAAAEAGGSVAMAPMAIGDEGHFSIYLQGGIEYGLWKD